MHAIDYGLAVVERFGAERRGTGGEETKSNGCEGEEELHCGCPNSEQLTGDDVPRRPPYWQIYMYGGY